MENKNVFNYKYSSPQNKEVARIRQKYLPHEEDDMSALKRLDLKVKRAGVVPALISGVTGCLIFGLGICFFLDVFAGEAWITVGLMLLGSAVMIPAYPIFKIISSRTKKRLAPKILVLLDKILNQKN